MIKLKDLTTLEGKDNGSKSSKFLRISFSTENSIPRQTYQSSMRVKKLSWNISNTFHSMPLWSGSQQKMYSTQTTA